MFWETLFQAYKTTWNSILTSFSILQIVYFDLIDTRSCYDFLTLINRIRPLTKCTIRLKLQVFRIWHVHLRHGIHHHITTMLILLRIYTNNAWVIVSQTGAI